MNEPSSSGSWTLGSSASSFSVKTARSGKNSKVRSTSRFPSCWSCLKRSEFPVCVSIQLS